MNKYIIISLFLLGLIFVTSCSTKHYALNSIKKDPNYVAIDEPEINAIKEQTQQHTSIQSPKANAISPKEDVVAETIKPKKKAKLLDPNVIKLYKGLQQTKFKLADLKTTFKESNVFSKPNTAENFGIIGALITMISLLILAAIGFSIGLGISAAGNEATGSLIMTIALVVAAFAVIYFIIKLIRKAI